MTMTVPRVSICIPVKNMERTIRQTVESALSQTYEWIEVLVVDNCSTDRTVPIVSSLKDPRLRVVQNERDVGVFGNHNRCLELADGELVKFLHGDDLLHSNCVEEMVRPFDAMGGEKLGCVSCGAIELDLGDREFQRTAIPSGVVHITGSRFFQMVPAIGNFIGTPSMTLLRKSAMKDVGGFDPIRRHGGDLDGWLRISRRYDFAVVPHHLVSLRSDPPPAEPAKRYDYTAILHQLAIQYNWFAAELGGIPLWRSPLAVWMCRESVLYALAYSKEACLGRPEPLRKLLEGIRGYGLLPQLIIQVLKHGPLVLCHRFFPPQRSPYSKVEQFFAALD